ncbi:transglutaminase family protein [Pseudomonas monteilii]|jgi:transglutaminase-like putative cysteine protease|uniref:Transglutaminase domain-containing protein n=2 Tax=Pseudomonas putida group TaxID=136845 RepID=A0AAE6RAV9_9PSED|nr:MULTISPECIES: transglutaminase family protein [Pseudomonas]MBB3270060.1 transglutaminase-like putative cysteine protease [Pseudomonas sp. OG7]MBH3396690.1 transglutaminase family protein [Pseudomonas monteilii]MBH3457635.1 transglutaminase family protein [Pseudomonas monteilii]MCJ7853660.1 transglutaminase family protein [Pseudomonas monteilii]MDD2123942.1 transglutaminase family protein [Pseudomonas monteilii]
MKLSIRHDTTYSYASDVSNSIQFLRLTPRSSARQRINEWQLGLPCKVKSQIDPYGNILHVLTLDKPHGHLALTASGQVEIDPDCEQEAESQSPLPFLRVSRLTQADDTLKAFATRQCGQHRDRAALTGLMQGLAEHMPYSPGATSVGTTAIEAFNGGAGVCQDHTHAFLACARSLGVPARYVSGYLCTEDEQHLASHAWAEAWIDDAWYSFDITNRLTRPDRHLKLAVGLDYLDACPVRGVRRGGGIESMQASVHVHRQ